MRSLWDDSENIQTIMFLNIQETCDQSLLFLIYQSYTQHKTCPIVFSLI